MLKIVKEYRFQLGGSRFYASYGDCLKVRLRSGEIIVGDLVKIGLESGCFDLDTDDSTINGTVTIDCEDVIDIIPM